MNTDKIYETVKSYMLKSSPSTLIGEGIGEVKGFNRMLPVEGRTYFEEICVDEKAELVTIDIYPTIMALNPYKSLVSDFISKKINPFVKLGEVKMDKNGSIYVHFSQLITDDFNDKIFKVAEGIVFIMYESYWDVLSKLACGKIPEKLLENIPNHPLDIEDVQEISSELQELKDDTEDLLAPLSNENKLDLLERIEKKINVLTEDIDEEDLQELESGSKFSFKDFMENMDDSNVDGDKQ